MRSLPERSMAMIDIVSLALGLGLPRLSEYGVISFNRIPDTSSGVPGELLVLTVDERLWDQIIKAPEHHYPARLLALYAELTQGLAAVTAPPISSELVAQAIKIATGGEGG